MFGISLVSLGTFFEEIFDSIGKNKVINRKESLYTMAFLSSFWATIFFIVISLAKQSSFIFSLDSLPTFLIRAVLEVVQMYVTVLAVIKSDRSTFGFVRTITIPLLLLADLIFGYQIGWLAIGSIAIIMFALLIIFSSKGIKKEGLGLLVISAINAVFTISLYKYDITNFNSVVAEQLLMNFILLVCFFSLALFKARENPLLLMKKPIFFVQSFSVGVGGLLESFAYNYGAASIILAAKRSSAILWSILAGKTYFKEQKIVLKIILFLIISIGLMFLGFN